MAVILIVEDHIETNEMLCILMRHGGHKSVCAFSGEDGLAMIGRERPDLVILDQMMPGMDGIEVLRILRMNPETALLPVVIYSAMADPTFTEHAMRNGASEVWLKDGRITPRMIIENVARLVKARLSLP
jgi:CheY-like chemotaxis protein